MAVSERDAVAYTYENVGVEAVSNRNAAVMTYENIGFETVTNRNAAVMTYENIGFGFNGITVPTRTAWWGTALTSPDLENMVPTSSVAVVYTYEGDVT